MLNSSTLLLDQLFGQCHQWLRPRLYANCSIDGWRNTCGSYHRSMLSRRCYHPWTDFSGATKLGPCVVVKLTGPASDVPPSWHLIAGLGVYPGNIYLKAQMSVKCENFRSIHLIPFSDLNAASNARFPVLAHFGATIAGLGYSSFFFSHSMFLTQPLISVPIRAYEILQSEIVEAYRPLHQCSRTSYNLN